MGPLFFLRGLQRRAPKYYDEAEELSYDTQTDVVAQGSMTTEGEDMRRLIDAYEEKEGRALVGTRR